MEALAAIGLASNLLQFVDVGYKVVSTAKEMYGTGSEASRANENIELITKELKRLSMKLNGHGPTSQATEDEQALSKLTRECQKWSDETLALLEYLKNRNPKSCIGAARAAVRNYRKKGEKEQLVQVLDSCRRQLDLQLTSMSRSEIMAKIRDLSKSTSLTNTDVMQINDNVKILQQSLQEYTTNISSQSLEGLRELLRVSDQTLMWYKQENILRALRFEGMGNRFHDVEDAHEKTFEWLLEEHGHNHPDDSTSQENTFRLEARERFTDWLQHRGGIFHISGKPGAGKSTLMKFLCKNQLARRYLENWSSGKALVFAKTFFWRLGNDSQKSLTGLIRTLLYETLSAAPALIPIIFPTHWGRVGGLLNSMTTLELDEIEQAFDNLLTNQITFEKHKIVFFIDGLDEYKGHHTGLVRKLFSWTSSNPDNLKICVASREWTQFTVGFERCPKLRIHKCTHEDISAFVNHRIKQCSENFRPAIHDSLGFLVEKITSKAEGVFIWVRLALNATEDGILNGDSVSDLEAKIDAFPSELGDLYQHLFDSIHVSDRQKAFETLRMVSYVPGSDSGLRLLQFWFLNKVIVDPDFAIKMPVTETSEENLTEILKTAQRQIYGRCKGLLEVRPLKLSLNSISSSRKFDDTFPPSRRDGEVRFMHSTAYEFLKQSQIDQAIDKVVGHVDIFHRICHTFLASLKFANEAWYFHHHVEKNDSPFNYELCRLLDFAIGTERVFSHDISPNQRQIHFLNFLDEVEVVTMARLSSSSTYRYHVDRQIGNRNTDGTKYVYTSPQTHIQSLATSHLIHEFLRRKDMAYLKSISSGSNPPFIRYNAVNDLALILLSKRIGGYGTLKLRYDRLCDMLEMCFSRGISPNYVGQFTESILDYMILMFIFPMDRFNYDNDTEVPYAQPMYPVRLLELCLRYGARSQLRLRFGPIYQHKLSNVVIVEVKPDLGPTYRDKPKLVWSPEKTSHTAITSPISVFAKKRGWTVTLRDLIELWAPDDHEILQSLLDRNNRGDATTDVDAQWPVTLSYSEDELKKSLRTIELREDLYLWYRPVGPHSDRNKEEWKKISDI
ncbi:hypothetical protein F4818DRAFT_276901 [Hypoxylon cercidicola]|nr:hypothetical protein F4818DRAFT_276901 [Hypoxylon cercidicola]